MSGIISYIAEGFVQLGYTVYTTTGTGAVAQHNVARLGDKTFGVCRVHGNQNGKIISCSEDTFANGQGIARNGDTVQADCGHIGIIKSSSTRTFVNKELIARMGDQVVGTYTGNIISGSPDVLNGF